MSEIRFYHLERQSMEQVLPTLLTKALASGKRIVVKAADEQQLERLNDHLWTYAPESFLPHGSKKDGFADSQPVWLTTVDENPNRANILILADGASSNICDSFSLCCDLFDGTNEESLSAARARWVAHKASGHALTYWQQGSNGWEKKSG